MSTPSSKSAKACAVSGCNEPRLQRAYCARHLNASLGKSDPLRIVDLEKCVQSVYEAMIRGVDAMHASSPANKESWHANPAVAHPAINEYVRLLQPYTEKLLENIRSPNSPQPLQGSALDIFQFSALSSVPSSSAASDRNSPPRPVQPSPSDSDLASAAASGGAPPSPEVNNAGGLPSATIPSVDTAQNGPIIDIKVQFSKQKKKTPDGYELLERSISGKYEADVNKSGSGKNVMLCFRRGEEPSTAVPATSSSANAIELSKSESDSDESGSSRKKIPSVSLADLKPITALSVIFRDASEEPPYGFVAIDKTTLNVDANLNNHSGSAGRQVYLCVHRGEGAPIYDLGVIFHEKRETLPAGFHEVKHTPFGNRADLNAAMNGADGPPPSGQQAIFLCFRPHITPVLQTYPPLLSDAGDSVSKGHMTYARVLALLTALLYSYDQKMVLHSLEAFMKIPTDSIPPVLLNRFLQCVCDAAPCFQTYFTTQAHSSLLKFLSHSFKSFYSVLSLDTFAKTLECCFLTRHEDKQNECSEGMIAMLIGRCERAKPCVCSLKEMKESQAIGMNAVAGGEGHSAKLPAGNSSNATSSPPSEKSPSPPVSSVLCHSCQSKRAMASAPLPAFCREVVLNLASRVHTAKEVEAEVKTFQRHATTGVEFRTDIAKITAQLAAIDQAHQSHLDKVGEPQPQGSARPSSGQGQRGSIIGSLAALTVITPGGEENSPSPTPLPASASASAFVFDEVGRPKSKQSEKDRLWLPNKEERFLQLATLICAKFAGESVALGLTKSEQMKRKLHALRLLFYILHHGVYFFRSTVGGILLVRRFLCPALMSVCVTDHPLLWRLLLQTWTVLFDQYKQHLLIELGVFFDHVLLTLLESPLVTLELKKDILDLFTHILAKSPEQLVGLFYNYDNSTKNWTIFERLNTVLARMTEGEQKNFLSGSSSSHQQAPMGGPPLPAPSLDGAEAQEDALQRQALKLLVHNLHMIAQWIGVPGLKRSPDIPTKPLIDESEESDPLLASALNAPASNGTNSASATGIVVGHSHRPSRIDTWSWRHAKQKSDQKILQEALKLAKTDKLKSALQYLRIVDPSFALPKAIAHFLYSNEGLDKAEVGDLLGSCGDKFMDDADYASLRAAYIEHSDFTGMHFDQALRIFLCDSGFRLPGEAQKIDRLLEAFCVAYCRDNPAIFRNHSSAFIVSFALVMLNTDLHDSRLKTGASRRQPMTEDQFIGNLRGVDDNHDFPRVFLEQLYSNIAAQAIEWKEKGDAAALAEAQLKEGLSEAEKAEDQLKAIRKTFDLAIRRAMAHMKNWAAHESGYHRTSNTMIAGGMFEVIWIRTVSALTLRSDNYKPGDVELLHVCLEGLAYGSTIAICLGLSTERAAFSRQLAKITFVERNRESIKGNNLHIRIVQGEHLKQEWYRPFNLLCEKSPAQACHVIFDCAHDIKQKINYERRQAKLRQVEGEFNHEIVLVDPSRSFVREGWLTKVSNSSANKRTQYMFMLFNDLVLYASEGMNSKWKCHRVVHLSLCRLEDLRGIAYADLHAFRIVSPQKSFIISAPTKEKKQQWLEAIFHHLKLVMAKRKKYIEEARTKHPQASTSAGALSPSSSTSTEEENVYGPRRISTFIGQSDAPGAAAKASTHCKLCIRPWAIFRRKNRCRFCADSVCNDCCTQKCMIPGGEKRLVNVCDACVPEGTMIPLASRGLAVPVETVQSGDSVLALAPGGAGVTERRVVKLVCNGMKECVELTFSDGRTIECTPDHRVRLASGEWRRADELEIPNDPAATGSEVVVTMEYPAFVDDLGVYTLHVPNMGTAFAGERAMLLARLCGFTHWRSNFMEVEHSLDELQLRRDLATLGDVDGIECPLALSDSLSDSVRSLAPASDESSITSVPAFVLEPACPAAVVREYLGGLLGSSAKSVGFDATAAAFTPITLSIRKCSDVFISPSELSRFGLSSQHTLPLPVAQQLVFDTQLRPLFARCGLVGDISVSLQVSTVCLTLCIDTIPSFVQKIGFRYSSWKQMRVAAAHAYFRALAIKSPASVLLTPATSLQEFDTAKFFEMDAPAALKSTHLPSFRVSLVGRRSVGLKRVYDIQAPAFTGAALYSPADLDSFVAESLLVHNCFGALKGMIGDEVKLLTASDS